VEVVQNFHQISNELIKANSVMGVDVGEVKNKKEIDVCEYKNIPQE
jgi:hypothetical protein